MRTRKAIDHTYRVTDAGIRSEVIVGRHIPNNAPPKTLVFLDGRDASIRFYEDANSSQLWNDGVAEKLLSDACGYHYEAPPEDEDILIDTGDGNTEMVPQSEVGWTVWGRDFNNYESANEHWQRLMDMTHHDAWVTVEQSFETVHFWLSHDAQPAKVGRLEDMLDFLSERDLDWMVSLGYVEQLDGQETQR